MTAVFDQLRAGLADRYEVVREIGRGGMATVYLARDVRHDRDVAIKVLAPELADAVGPERFTREIRLAARLSHPHILPQLPVPEATRIAAEVAEALDYAHREGCVHRDVKPGNILLQDGHALLADRGTHWSSRILADQRFLLGRPFDDLLLHLRGHRPRPTAPRPIFQTPKPRSLVSVEPSLDRGPGQAQMLSQLIAGHSIRGPEHDPRSLHLTLGVLGVRSHSSSRLRSPRRSRIARA